MIIALYLLILQIMEEKESKEVNEKKRRDLRANENVQERRGGD